jgi:hypothetical protein
MLHSGSGPLLASFQFSGCAKQGTEMLTVVLVSALTFASMALVELVSALSSAAARASKALALDVPLEGASYRCSSDAGPPSCALAEPVLAATRAEAAIPTTSAERQRRARRMGLVLL